MVLLVVLLGLTTHFLTYVVTRSEFPPVRYVRDRTFDRYGGNWLTYLITCSFCSAFYVAGVVTLMTDRTLGLPQPVLHWLAAASVGGTLVEIVDALRAVVTRSS